MTLTTERLILRPFSPEDGPGLYGFLGDPQVVAFEPYGVFTPEECEREAALRAENPAFWAVCQRQGAAEGPLVGNITMVKGEYGAWELGFVLRRQSWGRGYAAEAAGALLERAFTVWQAHRVTARCNPLNHPSRRLLEKLGMRCEGRLLQNVYFSLDEHGAPCWQDTLLYALLRQEWAGPVGGQG